jgi:hypothetical protein
MKNTFLYLLLASFAFAGLNSCKKATKKTAPQTKQYSIDPFQTAINWTAYKTTDKVPVSGKFTLLTLENPKKGSSMTAALNGSEFSIPVSSIYSNNEVRDYKLKNLFFGVMKNTNFLSGTLYITDKTSGYVDFAMNGVVEKLPFAYVIEGKKALLTAVMNTDSWQAQSAIASINEACLELHKGADGVSKTWSDVAIQIEVYFKSS